MGDFPWKIDLKNAYQCIQVHPLHRKFIRVKVERENPLIQESPFRPHIRPKIIYKNLETYGGHTPLSGSETSDLFRRRVNSQSNKRGSGKKLVPK